MRVVSVLPSATEIVCALGRRDALVGRSAECDFPESVRTLPIVMRPRTLDAEQPSAAIDARVTAALGRNESLYELDVPALRDLKPDVLLTQDLCAVCSVTGDEVVRACREAGVTPNVLALTPRSLPEVWESIESVARAIGEDRAGARLVRMLRARRRPSPTSSGGPRIAVIEWLDPPILAGLWVPDMIRAAGGRPVELGSEAPAHRTRWSALSRARPDLVVLSPCSFSVARTRRELLAPSVAAGLADLAPPLGVWIADEAYFSRPGPRLADGVDLLRELVRARTPRDPPIPIERLDTGMTGALA
jgi:iron complex transport system substrate-binding protein